MAGLVPAISIHGGGGAAFSLSPFTGRGWRAPDGASRVAVHGSSSDPPSLKLRRVDLARIAGREKRHAVCAVQNLDSNLKQRFGRRSAARILGGPAPGSAVFLFSLDKARGWSAKRRTGLPSCRAGVARLCGRRRKKLSLCACLPRRARFRGHRDPHAHRAARHLCCTTLMMCARTRSSTLTRRRRAV